MALGQTLSRTGFLGVILRRRHVVFPSKISVYVLFGLYMKGSIPSSGGEGDSQATVAS